MALSLELELEEFLSGIGFELVSMEKGGGRRRPLLRLRVDRPDSRPGHSSVTVDDCAAVSRAVREFLEERGTGEDQWVLEVSSPGLDRKLTKPAHFRRFEGENVKVGITDFAQDQLGDIVFVEMPEVGETIDKGAEFGTVESVKAVSELYLPVSGEIVAINEALEDAPELINNTPFSDGWMIEVKLDDSSELDALMDKDAYLSTLKG